MLKSLVATGISQVVLKNLYADDGSDNDAFRKIMREAFSNAVKKVRKFSTDSQQQNYVTNEFRFYQRVLIDELVKMEPVDRKKYIENTLYDAFKAEVMKRPDALQHFNMALAQEAVRNSEQYMQVIMDMNQSMAEANRKLDSIINDNLNKAKMSGLCPSNIVENDKPYATYIPALHSERKDVISELAAKLKEKHSVLLYAGVKEGKTVAAALLSKMQAEADIKTLWIDFAQENSINLELVLSQQSEHNQLLFVLDHINYDNDSLYKKLCWLIINYKRDNWYFLIVCYEKLTEVLFDVAELPEEFALPPLTQEEVGEMIPEDKRDVYQGLIHALFGGQPMLTNMACAYLQEHEWNTSAQEIGDLFTFPKGTNVEKKIKRLSRRMMDDDAYALVNRLLLLDRQFTAEECRELAAVSPRIANPIKKLSSLCGTWVTEENGFYCLSPLLRKTIALDLLPEERRDCCQLIARKIIKKEGGITPNDALHVLNMLTTARNSEEAAGFYVSMLYKLDEEGWLDHDAASLWRAIWIDLDLPEWMTLESKAVIRVTQMLILLIKHHVEAQYVVEDMERLIDRMPNNSEMKSACVRLFIGYLLLNNKSDKLGKYKELTVALPEIPTLSELNEEKFIFVALNNVKTQEELLAWAKNYKDAGSPEIEFLPDGVILKVNTICNAAEEKLALMEQLTTEAFKEGYELVATVVCSRWLDELSEINDIEGARIVWEKYGLLAKTKLGELLLNYSYGLCLCNNGYKEEGHVFVEKACNHDDIETASMVKLNASAKLTELLGMAGNVTGAAEVMRKLVEHPDFDHCYTDFEKGAAYGTLSYAYWMAGEKVKAIEEMLKVEQIIWDYREKQDDDFKNLSMRFSVLALTLASEELKRPMDENFISAEYCLFMKPSKNLLEGYKTERNFTVLYAVYHLSELVLQDDDVSLRVIDHMLAMQKTDAAQMASLLSALMQAFPLLVNNDREETLQYIVLSALAGVQEVENKGHMDYEGFVLVNAIAALVMKRTIMMADGKEEEDVIFDMAAKSVKLLPKHDKTDMVVAQMKSNEPDYSSIKDLHEWGIVATYHIKDITPAMGLTAMYVVVKTVLETSGFESSKRLTDRFVKSFAYLMVKEYENRFNLELKDFDRYFGRIGNQHGMEYLRKVMQGLHFNLKTEPDLDKDIVRFIEV